MSVADDADKTETNDQRDSVSGAAARRLTIVDNRVDSRDLFIGTRDIVILHGRDAYRLRLTAQNKLILTK